MPVQSTPLHGRAAEEKVGRVLDKRGKIVYNMQGVKLKTLQNIVQEVLLYVKEF